MGSGPKLQIPFHRPLRERRIRPAPQPRRNHPRRILYPVRARITRILSLRQSSISGDIKEWYSNWNSLLSAAFNPFLKFLMYTGPTWFGRIQSVGYLWMRTRVGARSLKETRKKERGMYREYYKEIRRIVPNKR